MKAKQQELKQFVSKGFNQKLPKISNVLKFKRSEFETFWTSLTYPKQTYLYFFSKDLIDLINKTNCKLLCADLVLK
jgi:hypothetical protein